MRHLKICARFLTGLTQKNPINELAYKNPRPRHQDNKTCVDYKADMLFDLKNRPEKRPEVEHLISLVFPKGSPLTSTQTRPSLRHEFALLLHPSNSENVLFIEVEKKIVATASYTIFEFQFGPQKPKLIVAGIGLVCTHPDFQKKGYGFQIQQEIEKRATEKQGAILSVLWSEQVQFYTKLNYLIAGTELQWVLDSKDIEVLKSRLVAELPDLNKSEIRIEKLKQFEEIQTLYTGFARGPFRPTERFSQYNQLLELPNTFAIKAIHQTTGKVKGYGIMGKGRDLRDTVHELIGLPGTLAPMLKYFLDHTESSFRVHQPHNSPLQNELSHWLGVGKKEGMSFFKVFSGEKLIEWMNASQLMPPGIGLVSPTANSFSLMNRHISFFDSSDFGHLLQLFFGPWEITELDGLSTEFKELAPKMPGPVPLYFWGMDSV
jgi:hypothetical protein